MATNAKPPAPPTSNGVITAAAAAGSNRKKAKRRAKQAAKAAAQAPVPTSSGSAPAGVYDEDPLGYGDEEDDYEYSDGEPDHHYASNHHGPNGVSSKGGMSKKKNKKKKGSATGQQNAYDPDMLPHAPNPPPPPPSALRPVHKGGHGHDTIWNTSTAQERQNIKEFWLSLSEEERKSLLKIEKEAVLKKMKQQQKHSCSCTVCGRKRTAIEEELEVLYEGYYEELEQYAHHDHPPLPSADGLIPDPLHHRRPHPMITPPPPPNPHHKTSAMHEHLDDREDDDEEYSEDDEYSDDEYSDDDSEPPPQGGVPDFFNFGQNLTVKGILTPWLEKLQQGLKGNADNLLTVADDLLKNDGRKFIEMMEQLAERRMQRESEAEYAASNPNHHGLYAPGAVGMNQEDPLAAGDDFDDDEASYDSQEEYDDDMEDEDEMVSYFDDGKVRRYIDNSFQGGLTEEQRMQEGRRMFQIFAARMFEQRVLNAYREKVAAERQQKLLEELQDETKAEAQRKAKKEREAQKKKEKNQKKKEAKAEEKARKEAERAAEEAQLREAQEKQLEEQRRKKEEHRKKKEEEKRKTEEERVRKETEKQRRQQEEQKRREDAERRRVAEKVKKEEQKKREQQEREAREAEARERKKLEDREKREREAKAKMDREAKERERSMQHAAQLPYQQQQPGPQIAKRPSQMGMIAVPGVYPKQTPSGLSSPHHPIATPAVPKAPTPAKQRQASAQGSLSSSPRQNQSQPSNAPSKSSSPGSQTVQNAPNQPHTMQKLSQPHMGVQHQMQTTSPLYQQPMQPPPGMAHPPHHQAPFGGMPSMGFPGFQGPQGSLMHGNIAHRGPMPGMFPGQAPPICIPNRMPFGPGNMNGMPQPPPGMIPPSGRGMGYPFDISGTGQPPPGFAAPLGPGHQHPIGQPAPQQTPGSDAPRTNLTSHSRQQSIDKERFESAANAPIARPAPIQRPSSTKPPSDERGDVDDITKIGSSALLGDDEPLHPQLGDPRRLSGIQNANRNISGGMGPIGGFGPPGAPFGAASSGFTSPFGPTPGRGQPSWNGLSNPAMGGWPHNNAAFGTNSAFGNIGGQIHRPSAGGVNRPLTIRLAVCQSCRQLSARGDGDEGFHDVDRLLQQIDSNRPMLDSPPSLSEIEEICETEGDGQNGGGELRVRKNHGGELVAVKWEQTVPAPDQGRGQTGLGEIGSPMPTRSSPAGFGAPGLGRGGVGVGFQSFNAIGTSPGC